MSQRDFQKRIVIAIIIVAIGCAAGIYLNRTSFQQTQYNTCVAGNKSRAVIASILKASGARSNQAIPKDIKISPDLKALIVASQAHNKVFLREQLAKLAPRNCKPLGPKYFIFS